MKCVVCAGVGSHFKNKICPSDTRKGYTKDNVSFKVHTKKFHGEAAIEAAQNFVAQLRADKERRFYNIRWSQKAHRDNPWENSAIVNYHERRLTPPGGSDGKESDKKSK